MHGRTSGRVRTENEPAYLVTKYLCRHSTSKEKRLFYVSWIRANLIQGEGIYLRYYGMPSTSRTKERRNTYEVEPYDVFLKSPTGPILSTPKCNFPSFPINFPYPYFHPSFARCLSRIAEFMFAVPAVSFNASLA